MTAPLVVTHSVAGTEAARAIVEALQDEGYDVEVQEMHVVDDALGGLHDVTLSGDEDGEGFNAAEWVATAAYARWNRKRQQAERRAEKAQAIDEYLRRLQQLRAGAAS